MRHLYDATPKNNALIAQAKGFERRRCNHHELEHPLSSHECLSSVVDAKGNLTNKHRYVVASQDPAVRAHMRKIAGLPLIYISKSVMILEPMATATEEQREREERQKFKAGLKGQRNPTAGRKRRREDEEGQEPRTDSIEGQSTGDARPQKKKKHKGPKAPNPLSVKKPKKTQALPQEPPQDSSAKATSAEPKETDTSILEGDGSGHHKRKRKHKPKGEGGATAAAGGEMAVS